MAPPPGDAWSLLDESMLYRVSEALSTVESASAVMLCRESEQGRVAGYCEERLASGQPGSLFISGLPGTGKSMMLRQLESACAGWEQPPAVVVHVNCLGLLQPRLVFSRILEGVGEAAPAGVDSGGGPDQPPPEVLRLRSLLSAQPQEMPVPAGKRKRSLGRPPAALRALLILDELDALASSRSDWVLSELFSLPALPGARCVLVGAANTMNLTASLRRASCELEPVLVSFPAYSVAQLGSLLRARLQQLPWRVFEEMALDLCARKCAASSGDARCAMQAARGALAAAAREAGEEHGELEAGCLVRMAHMAEALSKIFKSPVVDSVNALPSDTRMVLCALLLLFRSSGRADATLGQLSDRYQELCSAHSLKCLAPLGFSSACSVLADCALVALAPAGRKESERSQRLSLAASEEDVVFALQGTHFFARLLKPAAETGDAATAAGGS